MKGNEKVDALKLDKVMDCKIRGHELKLRKAWVAREFRLNFFTQRVINVWYYKQLGRKIKTKC